ncbi:MAG: EamA family transporter [Candidatus Thiodiazotropha sp.]|nr:EamA family transporter [Candidatus Thiodiazotropha sp. (ex Codakia orbicularis)]
MDNAYLLIGASVLMHVAWNLMARHVDSRANYLWWGLLAHLILLGPYAIWQLLQNADWELPLYLALLTTSVANTSYFIALRRAYHFAPVALVYPLARSSPILILFWSWLFFSQPLSAWELAAISISVVGLWILAASSRHGDTRHALPWTVLAALSTSVYSLSDKVAVEYLPGFAEQLGFISIGYATSFLGLTLLQRAETRRWLPQARPSLAYILIGGLFIGTAYALVVRAMGQLPAAHVVSFTNGGIVLAVLLSILVFAEREHWRQRLAGALVVSAGLVLLGWLS